MVSRTLILQTFVVQISVPVDPPSQLCAPFSFILCTNPLKEFMNQTGCCLSSYNVSFVEYI